MKKDNTTAVLLHYIASLNIPVTERSIVSEMQKHPDPDSMLGISEVLNNWNIPNVAYPLSFEQLTDVPAPFIAYLLKKEFAVVTHLDGEKVIVANQKWHNKVLSIDEFKKLYAGSVLIAEKEESSGEADYQQKRRKEVVQSWRIPAVVTGGVMILLAFLLLHSDYLNALNLQTVLLTVFKTAGLATAVLLLVQSIDANNPLVQKLCGDDNKNCSAILSSKAAKINDDLSWSEVGFFYFAGTWLVLLFNNGQVALMQALAVLSVLSLPYTFYSIYYQWKIAKQWCLFCCTVQAILWLEFFTFLPYLLKPIQASNLMEWSSLLTGLAIPVLGWVLIKPWLLQAKQFNPLRQQLRQFKYNTELFKKLLNEENEYVLPSTDHSLIIGNPEAKKVITMVANPYCQPCAKAHKALQWLDNRDDIKLQVLFSTLANEDDPKTKVASHLLSIQNSRNDSSLKNAMHDWYEQKQKNYETWAKNYPAEKANNVNEQLEKQREWCKMAEITGTPTLFINGRRFPKNYQPEDLKYFI